jgi:signal transduction histidine kinase
MSRALAPLLAASLALAGALAATLFLFRGASAALDRVLEAKLRSAGDSAALLLTPDAAGPARLRSLMEANRLEGAYRIDRSLQVVEDAGGRAGQPANLLRVDPDRARQAFDGTPTVARAYSVGELGITTGYFPLRSTGGAVASVLVLEGGPEFAAAHADLQRARDAGIVLSMLAAAALGLLAARWMASERSRQLASERAARGDSISRMAAMASHEIRNPLGVVRGTVELMLERGGPALPDWQRAALDDVLAEIERLRRLTEDLLYLAAPRGPPARELVDLQEVLADSARATESTFREISVRYEGGGLPPLRGDRVRLRQVFANLLTNAAQAQVRGEVQISGSADGESVVVRVRDQGPGLPPGVKERLFDPFLTTKAGGTGLGLAIAKLLVDGHGGTLALLDGGLPGTTFEVRLPIAKAGGEPRGAHPGG